MNKRVLAVDPGDKRIGLAISDETATIANPLQVLKHISRTENARRIIEIAEQNDVVGIVIGRTQTDDGEVTYQGRKSERLGQAILDQKSFPITYWNEDFSTNLAQESRRIMGVGKRNRGGHLDEIAATIILQGYLDAMNEQTKSVENHG